MQCVTKVHLATRVYTVLLWWREVAAERTDQTNSLRWPSTDAVVAWRNLLGLPYWSMEDYNMFQLWGGPATTSPDLGLDIEPTMSIRRTCRRHDWSGCRGGMKNSVLGIDEYPQLCCRL
jgi:hypothetical protein